MAMQDWLNKATASTAPFRRPSHSYPHRKTIDFDTDQFAWLNDQAFQSRVSAAALVRAALSYAGERDDVLADIVNAALAAERG